jgi:acetyl esterase/lipase
MIDGPRRWGFDYSFIIPRGHQNTPHLFLENERPVVPADQLVRAAGTKKGGAGADYAEPGWDPAAIGGRLLGAAEKFLDDVLAQNRVSGRRAPFFMHFCTDGAHSPYVPAVAIRGTPLREVTKMSSHTDMVLETDVLLGHLREILERRGLLDDTLICFTSDNGGIPAEHHLGHDAVGGLRGMKSYLPEGGHRVPFVVRWPGKVPAGTVRNQVVGTHDIVPTVLELAGIKIPAGQCLDAVSLVPVVSGARDDRRPVRRTLLVQSAPGHDAFDDGGIKGGSIDAAARKRPAGELFGNEEEVGSKGAKRQLKKAGSASDGMAHALYEGDWKLVVDIADEAVALYDLQADLKESRNLIADGAQADRVRRLTASYRAIRASAEGSRTLSAAGASAAGAASGSPPVSTAFAAHTVGEPKVYKKIGDRELRLHVLKPAGWSAGDRRPALVFFHGGGWTAGMPTAFNQQSEYLAARGMVCVQVEYRLLERTGKEPPLVCVQDAQSAMRWVRAHAVKLGIDPQRIGAGGGSAGGHLAAFCGMVGGLDDPADDLAVSPRPDVLVLFNPVFDNGPVGGWGQARVRERVKEFSPAHNVTADDPPAVVFLGREDKLIPVATVERFQAAMKKAGVRCETFFYDGQGHGFFNQEPYKSRTMIETDRFLASLGWLVGPPTLPAPAEEPAVAPSPPAAKKSRKKAG